MDAETYAAVLEFIAATPLDDPEAIAECGACGFRWNDRIATSLTPTPAGRCPNEYNHDDEVDSGL